MQNHTVESIKSMQSIQIAWVEEAQSLSQRSLTMLRPTIREPGSEIWFSWNPRSPKDPVDNFLRAECPPDAVVVQANYDQNRWFPDNLRAEMEYDRRRDPERYKHVWLGQYQTQSEARVFHNWKIDEFETPRDAVFYHGCDWGFSIDPTVLVRCYVDGRTLFVDDEIWELGCPIDHVPALFDRLGTKHASARSWVIVADSANPQNINYMSRHGYPKMRPSIKGPGSVEEGVEFLKSFDIVVHPRCKHVADELANYSYKIDPKTEQVLPVLADEKNHTIDSLRYAIEAVRRKAPQLALGGY
jgi:phage terminase large subunit